VIPQFLVTGLSSIVFAILDPGKSVHPAHNASGAAAIPHNLTNVDSAGVGGSPPEPPALLLRMADVIGRRDESQVSGPDSVVFIFRYEIPDFMCNVS